MSLFISFEGGEGSGKTTQSERLQQRLQRAGMSPLLVREPGTTRLGDLLRDVLKQETSKEHSLSPGAELFLFAASRAELVLKEIKPALERGDALVISDRFADSTMAYQGYGRRLLLDDVAAINRVATQGMMPDLTFLLDCPPDRGLKRLAPPQFRLPIEQNESTSATRIDVAGTRRFEEESLEFHTRVRDGYLAMAKQEPSRWCVIDATRPMEEIGDMVWDRVQERLRDGGDAGTEDTSPK